MWILTARWWALLFPQAGPIPLNATAELRAKFFTERRELGALNVGGEGLVHVGNSTYPLNNLDLIYIGRDNPEIRFESKSNESPAAFYILSYPAHTAHPVTLVKKECAQPAETGSTAQSNRRTIYKYIHAEGAKSCQLVMGVTHLHEGSTWNTMPAHRHMRRSEVYCYFDVAEGRARLPFHGTAGGDPPYDHGGSGCCGLTGMVHSRRCRYPGI